MHSEVPEQSLVPTEVHLALTSGLAPGAKLRENRIFTLSAKGVEFKGEPTLAQWMEGMLMLSWMKTAFHDVARRFHRGGAQALPKGDGRGSDRGLEIHRCWT